MLPRLLLNRRLLPLLRRGCCRSCHDRRLHGRRVRLDVGSRGGSGGRHDFGRGVALPLLPASRERPGPPVRRATMQLRPAAAHKARPRRVVERTAQARRTARAQAARKRRTALAPQAARVQRTARAQAAPVRRTARCGRRLGCDVRLGRRRGLGRDVLLGRRGGLGRDVLLGRRGGLGGHVRLWRRRRVRRGGRIRRRRIGRQRIGRVFPGVLVFRLRHRSFAPWE